MKKKPKKRRVRTTSLPDMPRTTPSSQANPPKAKKHTEKTTPIDDMMTPTRRFSLE